MQYPLLFLFILLLKMHCFSHDVSFSKSFHLLLSNLGVVLIFQTLFPNLLQFNFNFQFLASCLVAEHKGMHFCILFVSQ